MRPRVPRTSRYETVAPGLAGDFAFGAARSSRGARVPPFPDRNVMLTKCLRMTRAAE